MSFLKRLLLLIVAAVAAYCFWPRTASLTTFQPEAIATLQLKAWKQAGAKDWFGHAVTTYWIFDSQYHFPPISALKAALDVSRSASMLRTAADAADREAAAKPLAAAYTIIKAKTGGTYDPAAVAAQEVLASGLVLEGQDEPASQALASEYAQLYGGAPNTYVPAARGFVRAGMEARAGDWPKAGDSLGKAWTELHAVARK